MYVYICINIQYIKAYWAANPRGHSHRLTKFQFKKLPVGKAHTHTHIYIYIYIYSKRKTTPKHLSSDTKQKNQGGARGRSDPRRHKLAQVGSSWPKLAPSWLKLGQVGSSWPNVGSCWPQVSQLRTRARGHAINHRYFSNIYQ